MTQLTEPQQKFLESNHAAAMITVGKDGMPRAVRVAIAWVDGKLWSSGTTERVRSKRLRHDPRCTLFVFDNTWQALTLETSVKLIEGSEVPALSVKLFRTMQNRPTGSLMWFGKELTEEEFLQAMTQEPRLIYEFEIKRAYGV